VVLSIGTYGPWYWKRDLTLDGPALSSHKHVIGLTGQGKSKFLAHCFVELVSQGISCSLVDPHSDLADDVLAMLADCGLADDRLLFVDFGRRDRFVPFNVLRQPYPSDTVASQMVEACKRVWPSLADGNAPMFENVMLAGCRTLIEHGLPFSALPLLITDKRYRDELLSKVSDPLVIHYFHATFDRLSAKDQLDQTQSSLRRVFNLNFPSELRYSLGQSENLLDFRRIMDEGQSAIYDLGGLSEEAQRFLGALIAHGYETASLSRADTPERLRRPHHLFLDEFSMFSATSEAALGRILSLARKYRLMLWLAHQTWGQLSDKLANALQNTTRISFALGFTDARIMAPNYTTYDPGIVKHANTEELKQFLTVQETYEKMASELQSMKPRRAYVRYLGSVYKYLFFRQPAIKITKIKTPTVVIGEGRDRVGELREYYANKYTRPAKEVIEEVSRLLARETDERDSDPPPFSS
jgi:hypothetical protein